MALAWRLVLVGRHRLEHSRVVLISPHQRSSANRRSSLPPCICSPCRYALNRIGGSAAGGLWRTGRYGAGSQQEAAALTVRLLSRGLNTLVVGRRERLFSLTLQQLERLAVFESGAEQSNIDIHTELETSLIYLKNRFSHNINPLRTGSYCCIFPVF